PFQSVVAGEMIPLARVQDEVFAAGTLGHGVAIIPVSGTIVAPADATVSMLYPTNHAIGLTTTSGQEVLIHIGIDTVRLDGRFFKPLVSQGESVKVSQPLIKIDLPLIEKSGFDPTVIVLLPNTPPERIEVHEKTSVRPGDKLFS
ncbi:PTS glucose transporter subunit IIA, partial [Enterobacter quasiroggenkampii]|nr:PTS glucose transporter subunit IIA [Enterobacter quasiroggenkampii]